jgi:hypothetical protein
MVVFITSKNGFEEIKSFIISVKCPVWVGKDVLTKNEMKTYRQKGIELTEFSKVYDQTDQKQIEEALYTIQEHHPGESIFVERNIKTIY